MQVPPHMREAGGGLAHFPLPRPSWAADVGRRCGPQVWAAGMGSSPLIVGKLGCWGYLPLDRDGLRNARTV